MTAAERWRRDLAAWAIPERILQAAPESPWGFPAGVFADATREALGAPATPTHERIREALPVGGTLLDVGAGGGAASLPVAGAAGVVAVDESAAMLEAMAAVAAGTGVPVRPVPGRWPDVAAAAGTADVAVCANVAYNVAELAPFVVALTRAARVRVVLELTAVHPQSPLTPLWRHFWDLDRPVTPVAADALAVVREEVGVPVQSQEWVQTRPWGRDREWLRRRLCLGPQAQPELDRLLAAAPPPAVAMTTAWWPGLADR